MVEPQERDVPALMRSCRLFMNEVDQAEEYAAVLIELPGRTAQETRPKGT